MKKQYYLPEIEINPIVCTDMLTASPNDESTLHESEVVSLFGFFDD